MFFFLWSYHATAQTYQIENLKRFFLNQFQSHEGHWILLHFIYHYYYYFLFISLNVYVIDLSQDNKTKQINKKTVRVFVDLQICVHPLVYCRAGYGYVPWPQRVKCIKLLCKRSQLVSCDSCGYTRWKKSCFLFPNHFTACRDQTSVSQVRDQWLTYQLITLLLHCLYSLYSPLHLRL